MNYKIKANSLIKKYKMTKQTIGKFQEAGISLDDIETIADTRENLTRVDVKRNYKTQTDRPSWNCLKETYLKFGNIDDYSEFMDFVENNTESLEKICSYVKPFMRSNTMIHTALKVYDSADIHTPLERLEEMMDEIQE